MLVKAARKGTNDPWPRHPADIYGIIARDESCAVPARVLLLGNYFPPRQEAQLLPHYVVGRFPPWLSFPRARARSALRETLRGASPNGLSRVRRLREINSPVYGVLRVSVLLVSYARLVTLNPVLYRRYIRAVIEKQARRRSACPAARPAAYRSRRINDCRARLSGFSSAGILHRRFVAVKRPPRRDRLRDAESRGGIRFMSPALYIPAHTSISSAVIHVRKFIVIKR